MAKTKNILLGFLLFIIVGSTSLYVALQNNGQNQFALNVTKTNTKYYAFEDGKSFLVGTETNKLYDGSKSVPKGTASLSSLIQEPISYFYRTQTYKQGSSIKDYYEFDTSLSNIEQFPVNHKISLLNSNGLIYKYELKGLKVLPNSKTDLVFGNKMKLDVDTTYDSIKLTSSGTLTLTFKITSDNQNISIRFFDPPTTYYINSTGGSDSNSGLTPALAWKTITKLNTNTSIKATDSILFSCDGTWRSPEDAYITITSGNTSGNVTYGSYGDCPNWNGTEFTLNGTMIRKPNIYGSYNMSSIGNWSAYGTNLWKSSKLNTTDVGNIIFNNEQLIGNKSTTFANLTTQGFFWYNTSDNTTVLYSVGNPATYYSVIEVAVNNPVSSVTALIRLSYKRYITIRDLDLRYSGDFAINSLTNGLAGAHSYYGISIINNSISHIGGSYQSGTLRYGNGIQFYGSSQNFYVGYNTISNVWDACVTPQSTTTPQNITNNLYEYNIFENCAYGFEYFNTVESGSNTSNNIIDHNTFVNCGNSMFSNQQGYNDGRCIALYGTHSNTTGFNFTNNIFYNTSAIPSVHSGWFIGWQSTTNWKGQVPYFNNNLYYGDHFNTSWNNTYYSTLTAFKTGTGQESNGQYANPIFDANYKPNNYAACIMSSTNSYVGAIPCESNVSRLLVEYKLDNSANETNHLYDGTVMNGATNIVDCGKQNGSYYFNGTTQYINITNAPLINLSSTKNWSINVWVRPTTDSGTFLFKESDWTIGYISSKMNFGKRSGAFNTTTSENGNLIAKNEWQMLTYVYNSSATNETNRFRFYYNGDEISVDDFWNYNWTSGSGTQGTLIVRNSASVNGMSLDNLRVYQDKILSSDEVKSIFSETARTFYLAENGLDSNNGFSSLTPRRTIEGLNNCSFGSGDTLLFKTEDTFRFTEIGFPRNISGGSANYTTYSAYGTGNKPKLLGSFNLSSISNWSDLGNNLWQTNLVSTMEVGTIIVNDETSVLRTVYYFANLSRALQGSYWWNSTSGKTIMYSVGNPASYYSNMEVGIEQQLFESSVGYVKYNNLDMRYSAQAAVMNVGDTSLATHDVIAENNNVSFNGGAWDSSTSRWGGGISASYGVKNFIVKNNYFYENFDIGFGAESARTQGIRNMSNLLFYNNTVIGGHYCGGIMNYNLSSTSENITVDHNTCLNQGFGKIMATEDYNWVYNYSRAGRCWDLNANPINGHNFTITNNICYNPAQSFYILGRGYWYGDLPNMSNNLYYGTPFDYFMSFNTSLTEYDTLALTQSGLKIENNSQQVDPLFYTETYKPTSHVACTMSANGEYVGAIPCNGEYVDLKFKIPYNNTEVIYVLNFNLDGYQVNCTPDTLVVNNTGLGTNLAPNAVSLYDQSGYYTGLVKAHFGNIPDLPMMYGKNYSVMFMLTTPTKQNDVANITIDLGNKLRAYSTNIDPEQINKCSMTLTVGTMYGGILPAEPIVYEIPIK
jgi:hypothetical protein